jgi:hypothetical protein
VDLSEFVKVTLCQIIDGVTAAQAVAKEKGGNINPTNVLYQRDGQWNRDQVGRVVDVQFDVALTSSDGTATSEGIGVFLGTINLGAKGSSEAKSVAQTSVKFMVPLMLPPGQDARPQ